MSAASACPTRGSTVLAEIGKSQKIIPTSLEFVDIAGLVRGASKGEGLGNQFLANIREVDAIIHVLRCFEDTDVTHVEGSVDPVRDAETVETELMLADLEGLEKRQIGLQKRARGGDKEATAAARADRPDRRRAAGRQARPHRGAEGRGGSRQAAAAADHQAGALCLQRRGGLGRHRQCLLRAGLRHGRAPRAPARSSSRRRSRPRSARWPPADRAGIPGKPRAARERARSGHPRRLRAARPA